MSTSRHDDGSVVDLEFLRPTLEEGMRWLFDVEQPASAILQHHGTSLYLRGHNRTLRFCPQGWHGHPVVVLDVQHVDNSGPYSPPESRLAAGELAALAAMISAAGVPVVETWNGYPAGTGSVELNRATHPSLTAAVERYRHGCREHRTVFCGGLGECDWYAAGNRSVVPPRHDRTR